MSDGLGFSSYPSHPFHLTYRLYATLYSSLFSMIQQEREKEFWISAQRMTPSVAGVLKQAPNPTQLSHIKTKNKQ